MWKLVIVLIVLGYVAAGCGSAPVTLPKALLPVTKPNSLPSGGVSTQCGGPFQRSCPPYTPPVTYIPVCVIDGVPIYVAAQCANTGVGG